MVQNETHSLAITHPELAVQWHPTKNGDLTPEMVSAGSKKKVWWLLSYDVPMDYPIEHLRGKHFNFEWKNSPSSRASQNLGCPYLSGKAVWKGFNDLETINPELAVQWHPTKNGALRPMDVTAGSGLKVWWCLPYDVPVNYPIEQLRGKHFDFEWIATINDRNKGHGCPYLDTCASPRLWKGFNDLSTRNLTIAAQWHPTKNGCLMPDMFTAGSEQKVWWLFPYDVPMDYPVKHLRGKHFDFEWQASIYGRAIQGLGCPFLSNHQVWKGFNDLETLNPLLAAQWHPSKNAGLKDRKGRDVSTPDKVATASNQKVWWKLPYDVPMDYPIEHLRGKHFDFEWEAIINTRKKSGCPYLSGQAVWKGFNDLATTYPDISAQWHPTKNGNLRPEMVIAGSHKKVWWLMPYDSPDTGKHFDFEWEATIESRSKGIGCPYLIGKAVWKGFNDLETVNPELARELHPTKNGNLKSTDVTIGSRQKVWWMFSYDVPTDYPVERLRGKHFDFEWEATISDRNNNQGCPFLSGHAVWKGFNDLATVNPELSAQWHPTKNGQLKPTDVTIYSNRRVWWLLPYDDQEAGKHFDFEWKSSVSHRSNGRGCPYLSTATSPKVWKGFNDLATVNPELAKEWHPTKNGDLRPVDIVAGSGLKVWWYLPYNDHKTGEYYEYEWEAVVGSRNKGIGCPFIASSKGEEAVRKILKSLNIHFEEQYKFKDRFFITDKHPLRDDFAIFDKKGKVVTTIEFHGQQHYEPVDFAGKGQDWAKEEFKKNQERDKIKTEYLEARGIKQLVIPYTEFDNVEKIVNNFINELSKNYEIFNKKTM